MAGLAFLMLLVALGAASPGLAGPPVETARPSDSSTASFEFRFDISKDSDRPSRDVMQAWLEDEIKKGGLVDANDHNEVVVHVATLDSRTGAQLYLVELQGLSVCGAATCPHFVCELRKGRLWTLWQDTVMYLQVVGSFNQRPMLLSSSRLGGMEVEDCLVAWSGTAYWSVVCEHRFDIEILRNRSEWVARRCRRLEDSACACVLAREAIPFAWFASTAPGGDRTQISLRAIHLSVQDGALRSRTDVPDDWEGGEVPALVETRAMAWRLRDTPWEHGGVEDNPLLKDALAATGDAAPRGCPTDSRQGWAEALSIGEDGGYRRVRWLLQDGVARVCGEVVVRP